MIWKFLYNAIAVPLGWLVFRMLAMFDRKARRGLRGRDQLFTDLERSVTKLNPHTKRIWFHSSSMGEFEQGKPIIAALKQRFPDTEVIVSFFSPSGFEHSQNYKLASIITYIPFDSRSNADRFVGLVKPTVAVVVRYDLWPNHIWALKERGIPVLIASATLQATTSRAWPVIVRFHRNLYNCLAYILTVSERDKQVFDDFRLSGPHIEVIGDTRYDQVNERSRGSKSKHLLPERIVEGKKVLVIGSSWESDEREILPACFELLAKRNDVLVILVPHEPNEEHLEGVELMLNGHASHIRFSELNDYRGEQVLIIDSVGILMPLYQYAYAAFVGGSFGSGVHNVLEPAAYGVPILVGPKYENSQEAVSLLKDQGAFVGNNARELVQHLERLFQNRQERDAAGSRARGLVERNTGATAKVLSYLEQYMVQ